MKYENFDNKKEYLAYRKEWAEIYKDLSRAIRELKAKRKQFRWKYREKGMNALKRKTKIGVNPNYHKDAHWKAAALRVDARTMMEDLEAAKARSWELKQKVRKEAA